MLGLEKSKLRPTPDKKDIKVIKLQPSTGEESKGSAETKANSSDDQCTILNQEGENSNVNEYDHQTVYVSKFSIVLLYLLLYQHPYLVQNPRKEEKC